MRRSAILFMLVALSGVAGMAMAAITDVSIQPATPTFNDDISVLVSGVESGSMGIVDSSLTMNDMSLELDIYIEQGVLPVVTPWTHSENIGMLPIGTYDLMVNTIYAPDVTDTFTTSFEVVPEPTTLLLFLAGIPLLKKRKK